ncbi:hypothetical protein C8J57DRAFT_1536670 [Mycena rebaudengoi]|nr:hypothetical protein C8J57DRAFT_1536670 [Mycena rebaudengoi]
MRNIEIWKQNSANGKPPSIVPYSRCSPSLLRSSRDFISSLPANSHPEPSPTTAPLLVSQICRHWRHIALETSELWASVYISAETRQNASEFLEAWLRCAKGFPLSLHLNPDPTLVPSPVSFFATYSAQLRSLPTSKIFSGCAPDFPYSVNSTYILRKNLKMMLSFSRISPGPALLELSISGTISTSNLGTYPTLTRLVIFLSAEFSRDDNSQRDVVTHRTLEIFYICNETRPVGILDSLSLPSLRKLMIPQDLNVEILIHFLERSSCPLRYLEVTTGFSLVFDGPSTFFAAAASPLVVPLLHDLKVTTLDNDIDYSTVVEFLTSRRDTFHSLEINLECDYQATINFHTTNVRVAGIDAPLKHGAEMSVDDNFQQWIYLAKPLERRVQCNVGKQIISVDIPGRAH